LGSLTGDPEDVMLRAFVITTIVAGLASTAGAASADTIYSIYAGGGSSRGAAVNADVSGTVDVDANGQIISSALTISASFYTVAGYPYRSSGMRSEFVTSINSSPAGSAGNNTILGVDGFIS
jgi:hypothetical protein